MPPSGLPGLGAALAAPSPVLQRLTGLGVPDFAERHWGRAPLLRRGTEPGAFRDVLDLDGVDELLSRRGLRTPFLRLAKDGAVVDSRSFTGSAGAGAEIGDQEGPADSGAGAGVPGEHDGGADGGAEGPADSGAGEGTPGQHDGGADGGADSGAA